MDYFTGGDKPYLITGSDDHTAKVHAYAHNVFPSYCVPWTSVFVCMLIKTHEIQKIHVYLGFYQIFETLITTYNLNTQDNKVVEGGLNTNT